VSVSVLPADDHQRLDYPTKGEDFVGWPGGLEDTRHTLASTSDGGRFHLQESWLVRQESLGTTKERAIGYTCLDHELLGTDAGKCDWANTEFIGYSWFKDDVFAATVDLPFFGAMIPTRGQFYQREAVDDDRVG
jgi:hypothetical protein